MFLVYWEEYWPWPKYLLTKHNCSVTLSDDNEVPFKKKKKKKNSICDTYLFFSLNFTVLTVSMSGGFVEWVLVV